MPEKNEEVKLTEELIREYSGARAEWARQAYEKSGDPMDKVHFGSLYCICVEKGSELQPDDPNRKYKGRVVFLGNQVKDENFQVAIFQELSSQPATMQAAKAVDFMGLQKGYTTQQADATQAYTQAKLQGTKTWISLPRDQWPESWKGYRNPVCPLDLALYGHPDSGGHWEKHCEEHLLEQGFEVVSEDWRSFYHHPKLKLSLIVYVDDFKIRTNREHGKRLELDSRSWKEDTRNSNRQGDRDWTVSRSKSQGRSERVATNRQEGEDN